MPKIVLTSNVNRPPLDLDLNNYTVVTPNRWANAALGLYPRTSLAQIALSALANEHISIPPKLIAFSTLCDVVREVMNPQDVRGFARVISPTLVGLYRSGCDLDCLFGLESERCKNLGVVARRYSQRLEKQGFIPFGLELRRAIAAIRHPQKLFVYGFLYLRPDEAEFINAIADDGSILCLPSDGDAIFANNRNTIKEMENWSWEVKPCEAAAKAAGTHLANLFLGREAESKPIYWEFKNRNQEIRTVLAHIKKLIINGANNQRIALVVVDDAEYGPPIMAVAEEYGLHITAFYNIPLQQTCFGAWLDSLAEILLEDFPFEPTSQLSQNQFGLGLGVSEWEKARFSHTHGLGEWMQIKPEFNLLQFPVSETFAGYWQHLDTALGQLGVYRKAQFSARESSAAGILREEMKTLSDARRHEEPIPLGSFLAELREIIALLEAPFNPGKGDVELHNPESLQGGVFEHVFYLGAVEGMTPAPVKNDPVLDFLEISENHIPLPSAAQEAQRRALTFWGLLCTVEGDFTICYPKVVENQEKLPSFYLSRLHCTSAAKSEPDLIAASAVEWRRAYLRREANEPDAVLDFAHKAHTVEEKREISPLYDEFDGYIKKGIDSKARAFSASQLISLGQCPFKWFAASLLKLRELEEAKEELDDSLLGTLYHRVLAELFASETNVGKVRENLSQRLDLALARIRSDEDFRFLPDWDLRCLEWKRVLIKAIQSTDFADDNAEIAALEYGNGLKASFAGLAFSFKIDRIDSLPDCWQLIDYKKGTFISKVKDSVGKLIHDIQLPLYQQFLQSFPAYQAKPIKTRYFSITRAKDITPKQALNPEVLTSIITNLIKHLPNGYFPVDPDAGEDACEYCVYAIVCRRGPRLGIKEGRHGTEPKAN